MKWKWLRRLLWNIEHRHEKRYNKTELYAHIRMEDLHEYLQKKVKGTKKKHWGMVIARFDLKTNKLRLDVMNHNFFRDMMRSSGKDNKVRRFFRTLNYRISKYIYLPASKKDINTYLLEQLMIMVLANRDSDEYKEAKIRYQTIYAILSIKKSFFKPFSSPFFADNVGFTGEVQYFLSHIGMGDESKRIWDIRMNGKHKTEKQVTALRAKVKRECEKAILRFLK